MIENTNWKLKLGGHTANSGNEEDNLILSMKRAAAVRNYLIAQGVKHENIIIKYFGDKYPIASNDTETGRQLNRRVEMLLIMK